jgi:hypothetical protein
MANVVSLRRSARLHTPVADIVDEVVAKGIAPHSMALGHAVGAGQQLATGSPCRCAQPMSQMVD